MEKCQSCGGNYLHTLKCDNGVWLAPKKITTPEGSPFVICQDCGQVQGVWKIKLGIPIPPP